MVTIVSDGANGWYTSQLSWGPGQRKPSHATQHHGKCRRFIGGHGCNSLSMEITMPSIYKKISLIFIFSVLCLAIPSIALARTYGEGLYGKDKYQEPGAAQSTSGDGDKIAPVATLKTIIGQSYNLEPAVAIKTNWPTFAGISTEEGTARLKIIKEHHVLNNPYIDLTKETKGISNEWDFSMPYSLLDGVYTVDISASDKSGNGQTYPLRFLLYVKTGVTGRLELKIIEQKEIEEKAAEEKIAEEEEKAKKTEEEKKRTVSLEVQVVDTVANPVEGARVILFSTPQERISGRDGVASFEKVERGKHRLSVVFNNRVGEKEIDLTNDKIEIFKITIEIKPQAWYSPLPVKLFLAGFGLVVIILLGLLIQARRKGRKISQIGIK